MAKITSWGYWVTTWILAFGAFLMALNGMSEWTTMALISAALAYYGYRYPMFDGIFFKNNVEH